MKKKCLIPLLLTLSVCSGAYAANPFSDVPKDHWAYTTIGQLAEKGIIDGYPDGTFGGNRTITRYEMAQLVAKALAKGAIKPDDKLIVEFVDELSSLGLRVASLEKKADAVKLSGSVGISYTDHSKRNVFPNSEKKPRKKRRSYSSALVTNIKLKGTIDDNWTYSSTIRNRQKLHDSDGNGKTMLKDAYLTGKYDDNLKLTIGRYNCVLGDGYIYDDYADGIKAEIGKDTKFIAEFGRLSNSEEPEHKVAKKETPVKAKISDSLSEKPDHFNSEAGKFYSLGLSHKTGNLTLSGDYNQIKDVYAMGMYGNTDRIWTIGACYEPAKWQFSARYLHGSQIDFAGNKKAVASSTFAGRKNLKGSPHGCVLSVKYGKITKTEPHSYTLHANYYNQGASTVIAHTMIGPVSHFPVEGFSGYDIGARYMIAKNIRLGINYAELKGKMTDKKAHTLWSNVLFTF